MSQELRGLRVMSNSFMSVVGSMRHVGTVRSNSTAVCGTRESAKIRYARNSVCRQVPEAMAMIRQASFKADKARTLRDDCLISDIIATSTRGSRHEFCNEISANLSVRRVSYGDVRKHSHT